MKTKNMIAAAGILIALHALTLTVSCGTLSKQKSKNSNSLVTENEHSEMSTETNLQQRNEWQKAWMQEVDYSTALIYSDSVINYHPVSGFQLSKGTLFLTHTNQQKAVSETEISSNQENFSENNMTIKEQEKQDSNAIYSSKEKTSLSLWVLGGLGAVIAIWLWKRYRSG